MPVIKLNSKLFDTLEKTMNFPQFDLDYPTAIETIFSGSPAGPQNVLQLSASLIRVSQAMWEWDGFNEVSTLYELRVSGSGLQPVNTLAGLLQAIDNGLATGAFTKVEILREGVGVVQMTLGAGGYVLSSGAQSMAVEGNLPLNFTQFYDLVGLFGDVAMLDWATSPYPAALFHDLAAYGVSGLTVSDGATVLFAAHVTAHAASLSINGLTISVLGNFPDNFGEQMDMLWQMAGQMYQTGTIDLAQITNLAVTSLMIKDAAGNVLGTIATPTDGTAITWNVDAFIVSEVILGDGGDDLLIGRLGNVRSALAGLAGADHLVGDAGSDRLFGGTGKDLLNGGRGTDKLAGGGGRDLLIGGADADTFVFNPGGGYDRIADFAPGIDFIQIKSAARLSDLQFTDTGADVRIDFQTIHITVANTDIAHLSLATNFIF